MWKEFSEVAKKVYVQVAREDYGIRGRPTNDSRVGLLTGLSRREVGLLKKELESGVPRETGPKNRIAQLLSGWHLDPEFIDIEGKPRILDDDEIRFLIAKYAGDTPPIAVLKELMGLKLVRGDDKGYQVLKRDYVVSPMDDDAIRLIDRALFTHGTTLAHNVDPDKKGDAWYERIASNPNMTVGTIEKFNELLQTEGQVFLEKLDAWLTENEANTESTEEKRARVGVGVYVFEYPEDQD